MQPIACNRRRVEIGFGDRNYRRRKVGQNGAFGLVAGLNFYAAVKIIICDIVTQFGYLSG
jgi:hypothetical protein